MKNKFLMKSKKNIVILHLIMIPVLRNFKKIKKLLIQLPCQMGLRLFLLIKLLNVLKFYSNLIKLIKIFMEFMRLFFKLYLDAILVLEKSYIRIFNSLVVIQCFLVLIKDCLKKFLLWHPVPWILKQRLHKKENIQFGLVVQFYVH